MKKFLLFLLFLGFSTPIYSLNTSLGGGGGAAGIDAGDDTTFTGDNTFTGHTILSTTTIVDGSTTIKGGDVQMQGTSETHLFFLDFANNRVGIKNSAPSFTFDVGNLFKVDTLSGNIGMGAGALQVFPLDIRYSDNSKKTSVLIRNLGTIGPAASATFQIPTQSWTLGVDGTRFNISDGPNINDVQRFTILTDGNTGIGTLLPSALLQVAGDVLVSTFTVVEGSSVTFTGPVSIDAGQTFRVGGTTIPETIEVIVPISAASLAATITNGFSSGVQTAETTTTLVNYDFIALSSSTTSFFEFSFSLPTGWDESTVTFSIVWTATAGVVNSTAAFSLQALAISNSGLLDVAYGTAVEVTDNFLANEAIHITTESSALTIGGTPAQNDYILWRGFGDVANADLSSNLLILELRIRFTRDRYDDP